MPSEPPLDALRQAIRCHQQGKLEEARRLYEQVIAADPGDAQPCYLLANIHAQQRDWDAAERRIREAITRDSDNPGFYDTLGRILTAQQRLDEAQDAFRTAIHRQPDFAIAHNNLGRLLASRGHNNEAIHQFERAAQLQPEFAEPWVGLGDVRRAQGRPVEALRAYDRAATAQDSAWIQLRRGAVLQTLDRLEEAERCYRRAAELEPRYPDAYSHLGTVLQRMGRIDEAVPAYEHCLTLMPDNGPALAGLFWIMDLRGERDTALARAQPLIEQGRLPADAAVSLARVHQHRGELDRGIELLDAVVSKPVHPALEARASFALGELRDARGDYDAAFAHFRRANELKNMPFDLDLHRRQFASLARVFSSDAMAAFPRSGNLSRLPVFIVGMPRSGTSLVEEIIASHPRALGGGELELVGDLARGLPARLGSQKPYPDSASELDQPALAKMTQEYLQGLGAVPDGIELVTDKMPTNFLHLGFIELLLPAARVIHCRRDPLDTGLSCYFHDFLGRGLAFSGDLTNIGVYYKLYRELMAYWRETLSLQLLEIGYEDLVDDPESATRKLLEFLDLEWDERCLRFYESERTVITASSAQVRRPIYRSSVGRWKYYEQFLDPLKTALE